MILDRDTRQFKCPNVFVEFEKIPWMDPNVSKQYLLTENRLTKSYIETTSFTDSMVPYCNGVVYSRYIHSSCDYNHGDDIHSAQNEMSLEFTVIVIIH